MRPIRFTGKSSHKLDAKGRIAVPARFKTVLDLHESEGLVITVMSADNHLVAYPFDVWSKLEETIINYPKQSDFFRRFRTEFIGNSQDCMLDSQNRILIPPSLRAMVGIDKDIIMIGSLDHFIILSESQEIANKQLLKEDFQKEENREILAEIF
ncbi:division/cell wall cluster transcriptional repressor MraZ [Desulfococcaceae bacterium OttesenSCG-928-F15]|nr:division/cell wall cluster transcriptional repressor MraZ [Desulfococcaceae bacterium OttesenSCG-928-F15]